MITSTIGLILVVLAWMYQWVLGGKKIHSLFLVLYSLGVFVLIVNDFLSSTPSVDTWLHTAALLASIGIWVKLHKHQ